MIRKISLCLVFMLFGCVSINRDHALPIGTKIVVKDDTQNIYLKSKYIKGTFETEKIKEDVGKSIIKELNERKIVVTNEVTPQSALLEYKVIYVGPDKEGFEIGYTAKLTNFNGIVIYDDNDEKQSDDIEGVINKIAKRIGRVTEYSYVTPEGTKP